MKSNKFETEIKDQLSSREIQPTAHAWDRLDAMLSVAEQPKKKFSWLLIAASFIGFMFVGTMIFKSNLLTPNSIEVQNSTSETPNVIVTSKAVENQNAKSPKEVVTPSEVATPSKLKIQNQVNSTSNKTQGIAQTSSKKSIIKSQISTNQTQLQNNGVSINNQNQIAVNQKQEIQNQQLKTKNDEELLASVKLKESTKSSLKVNPASLLSQVDGEVTLEFRENVFTKVSKNLQTVKVALTERNNTK